MEEKRGEMLEGERRAGERDERRSSGRREEWIDGRGGASRNSGIRKQVEEEGECWEGKGGWREEEG